MFVDTAEDLIVFRVLGHLNVDELKTMGCLDPVLVVSVEDSNHSSSKSSSLI